ncbi:DNA-binding response regulator [Rubrivivax pictus]|uniref:DNA-binding response regulator n=2 Tax=Pseudaquabacterium pictum TaxID=2315236 RepID=A0A480APW2_9BURK|nr:DNA-binding response regulator [Rubrivivax pictus]
MKVLLVDDHQLFREGMALLLQPLADPLQVLGAGSAEAALELLAAHPDVDLVVMDLGMPGMGGLSGMALMRVRHPAVPLVALSSVDDKPTVLQALDAGAMGFVPKSASAGVMLAALRLILSNGIYLPPSVFLAAEPAAAGFQAPGPRHPEQLGLTPRQADVLYLILQGKPAKLIERELGLSAGTVKAHTSAVLRALNVTTRTQAVVAAGRLQLRFSAPAAATPASG